MKFETWQLWMLATIVFISLEIFIPSFVMMSIAIGCFFAVWGALLHGPVALQISFFIIGTLTGFLSVKPVMVRYAYRKKSVETNAAGLIGRIGKVVEEINPSTGAGCVAIDGDFWTARTETGEIISVNEKVKVIRLDSIIVYVALVNEIQNKTEVPLNIAEVEKDRFLIRIGNRTIFIKYDDVSCLYSKNKITHIVNREGKHFIHDESLDRLNETLPAEMFFRANRQFILKRDIISEVKSTEYGKIEVFLKPQNGMTNCILVSRLKAHTFRHWMKQI